MVEQKNSTQAKKKCANKKSGGAMKKASRRAMMFATIWQIGRAHV